MYGMVLYRTTITSKQGRVFVRVWFNLVYCLRACMLRVLVKCSTGVNVEVSKI